jgi:phage protein D
MNNVNPYLPTFSLIAEDKNITNEVAKYLTDLTFIDYGATGEDPQSDKLTINLVSPTMMLPSKGAKLKLALGFDKFLVEKGTFVVDSVSLQGPPRGITITALAVPSSNTLHPYNMQSQKTRSWDNVSIGEIVRTIAAENGLLSSISPELNNLMPGHLDQLYENDAEFLAKLARQYNAISKATGGYWVFMVQGSGKGASGKDLPAVTITPDGKTSWQFSHRSKAKKPSAAAAGNKGTYVVPYNDADTNETKELKYGSGDPITTSGHTLPNLAAAEQLIRSHQQTEARIAANANQSKPKPEHLMSMSIAQPATPELLALTPESSVTTEGFDPQADRSWIVDNIAFSLSPSKGMSVSMDLKR